MKTHISILMLCLIYSSNPAQCSELMDTNLIKSEILSVQKEVVDLTNPVEPLNSKTFLAIRKAMSEAIAGQIIEMVRQEDLTNTQAEIGVLLLSKLPEETYFRITEQLITTNTEEGILDLLLMPPLPYGPGYANAYKNDKYKNRLAEIRDNTKCGQELKATLDLILSGKASHIYADYLKHPDQYGY